MRRRFPEEEPLHTRLAVGRGLPKMFVRNVCKPDYDKKQNMTMKNGNEFAGCPPVTL